MSVFRAGTNKSSVNNFPSVRPTLDLDFANTKTLDPRITFTRASGGSYVGADGLIKYAGVNEARFDHDPVTGESLGLLIEESRQNLLRYSEEADNPVWNILGSSIIVDPNSTTSPDGNQTADKVQEAAIVGSHSIEFTGFAFQQNITYTVSFFAKAAERTRLRVTWPNIFTNRIAFVDIDTSTYGVISDGGTITNIYPFGNGWFRIVSTSTCTSTTTGARAGITLVDTGTNVNYTGDGTSGIYIWGAQLEVGASPTSYIPTQGSARTRAVDSALITGKNFSDFYNQSEGTFCVSSSFYADGGAAQLIFQVDNGSGGYRSGITFRNELSGNQIRAYDINASASNIAFDFWTHTGSTINTEYKTAFALKSNDMAAVTNYPEGTYGLVSSTSRILRERTTLRLGSAISNTTQLNGTISQLTYYPKRLPNQQLQVLTR